ncbi:hypothetical protein A8L45_12525 [Veronia pacifica]|uniref:AB hydrolase-1 domain-containing protein n=2 Tax=Veronia pacifica TaxID=1080227 RepID=A0A1C3EIA2_9GAMM|nr:hypothetical protein A8L45_12525 [Veronia pacifica]
MAVINSSQKMPTYQDDDGAISIKTFGSDKNRSVVFIHGWPDDDGLWDKYIDAMSHRWYCVVVRLPNFGSSLDTRRGHSVIQLADMLHNTLDSIGLTESEFDLVIHDWGAVIGYCYERKYRGVRKIVALDIGPTFEKSIKNIVLITSYQTPLVFSWWIGKVLPIAGNWLARLTAFGCGIRGNIKRVTWDMSYLYYFYLRDNTLSLFNKKYALASGVPDCPVCFMYGSESPIAFFTNEWIENIEKSGGVSKAIPGDHWFLHSHFDEVLPLIETFLTTEKPDNVLKFAL